DLTTRRAHRTTDVLTAVDHQLERPWGGTVSQASLATEVGDHTLTVDHHTTDVPGQRGADDVVTVDRHPVLGLAVLAQQVLGQSSIGPANSVDQTVTGEFVFETFLRDDEVQHQSR